MTDSTDSLATQRAYHQVEAEYQRGARSPETVQWWDEELAWLAEEEHADSLKRLQVNDLAWLHRGRVDPPSEVDDEKEALARRAFLSHVVAVSVGDHVLGAEVISPFSMDRIPDEATGSISRDQVDRIESAVVSLERLFQQHGASPCGGTLAAVFAEATPLWYTRGDERIRSRFVLVLAKLHNFAGWLAYHQESLDLARQHFGRALELGKAAGSKLLMAHVLCRAGQVYLLVDAPAEALKMFQLGQISAQLGGSHLVVAMVCALQVWAYRCLGHESQVVKLIDRMKSELSYADQREQLELRRDRAVDPLPMFALVDAAVGIADPRLRTTDPVLIGPVSKPAGRRTRVA